MYVGTAEQLLNFSASLHAAPWEPPALSLEDNPRGMDVAVWYDSADPCGARGRRQLKVHPLTRTRSRVPIR